MQAPTEHWLDKVRHLRTWKRDGQTVPYKGLLLLYALGRLQQRGTSEIEFAEAAPELAALLEEHGPTSAPRPEYPFYHLRSDGVWMFTYSQGAKLGRTPSRAQLINANAVGRLDPEFEAAQREDPGLLVQVARTLLGLNFDTSLHRRICAGVGLNLTERGAGG